MRVEGYSRDDFIRLADVKKKQAIEYCDRNPKDIYTCDDFIACYHSLPDKVHIGGTGTTMLWDESMSNFDRVRKIFEEGRYGE